MEYVIGSLLAVVVLGTTTLVGISQGRNFYPILLIIVPSYYILFAVMLASGWTVLLETVVAAAFMGVALVGFRTNLWFVAIALVGHGLFDVVHHLAIDNPGVPVWWPGFCMAFDVIAGGLLAVILALRPESYRCLLSSPAKRTQTL